MENFTDIADLNAPSLAPWQFTDDTEFNSSEEYKLKENRMIGKILKSIEADTESLKRQKRYNFFQFDDKQIFIATFEYIVEFSTEYLDHEEQLTKKNMKKSKFYKIFNELASNSENGFFSATNILCYDEEYLIDVVFTSGVSACRIHKNPNFDI
jgi:hypothetical protein